MPIATVGDAHTEQGGLFTKVKKERLNHLQLRLAPYQTQRVDLFFGEESDEVVARDLLQQCTNHTILVAPLRFHVITDAVRLSLKELALILSLSVYPV